VFTNSFDDFDEQKWHPNDSPRSPVFIPHAVEHLGSQIAQKLAADWYGGESFLRSKI